MFEHRKERLLAFPLFLRRRAICLAIAGGTVLFGVSIGVLGYHYFAGFAWIDALLNACIILAGMGSVGQLPPDTAKLFASLYATLNKKKKTAAKMRGSSARRQSGRCRFP
jgi:hypothetical protein